MIFFDTETCGLHGPVVLIQWARDNGDIELFDVWKQPVQDTLDLINEFCVEPDGVVGFNLAFDWFHINKIYNCFRLVKDRTIPPVIEEIAMLEPNARDGLCLKPEKAFDIMLHARKGPYQSTMERSDIRVKKVPAALAYELAAELDDRVQLKDVYFERKQNKKERFKVHDIHDDFGDVIPDFKDIVLSFAPSSALKALAKDALGVKPDSILLFTNVEVPKEFRPKELGFAPYALAGYKNKSTGRWVDVGPDDWKDTWPTYIQRHIDHWAFNELARKYAWDDVDYTRRLYEHFGSPPVDDDDSVLACMVGAVRWKGFKIDAEGLSDLRDQAIKKREGAVANFNSSSVCRKYLEQVLDETEKLVLRQNEKITTKGLILEEIAKWKEEEVCDSCMGDGCHDCEDGLVRSEEPHPAAIRAQEILDYRHAGKEIELYDKLLRAGRFHASFNVIGTLSSRMSGGDGLNAQGIKNDKVVRGCFPLAWADMQLDGGDFAGFEVVLADACYGDPVLHEELLSGKKIHGLLGEHLFPGMTYDEIVATNGLPGDKNKYGRSKNGTFCLLYMGNEYSLHNRVGIPEEVANEAYHNFVRKYKVFGEKRQMYADMFCSMKQPGGIGTKVEWAEPHDYIESMFGFRRYFTLENQIVKVLFDLAESPPKEWTAVKMKVVRRDRVQTASGACRSALFAAAFALQAGNMRAAGNHVIQSSGAQLTKKLQRRIWDLQPSGICNWMVIPFNVHDEIMAPCKPEVSPKVTETVETFVEDLRDQVPLLEIDWGANIGSWASK